MRKVVFRADGNSKIGYGHFVRTLGVAELIREEFDCCFATCEPTEFQLDEIKRVCKDVLILPNDSSHFAMFLALLRGDEIVVLDNYYYTSIYQAAIRSKGCKVIYIDDFNEKRFVCDVLINNIPGFEPRSFAKADYTKLCLGTDYALLRKPFFDPSLRNLKKVDGQVFLSFGGSDMFNISEKIVNYLNQYDPGLALHILIGEAYGFKSQLAAYENVFIHSNLSAQEVAVLMATSMVCIIPASSLLNEAASIGSKILLGFFTQNQVQPYNYFISKDLAVGVEDFRILRMETFVSRFLECLGSTSMVLNQKVLYKYQQERNIKNIFKEI